MSKTVIHAEQAGGEITIRKGEALPLKEPQKISLSGDINSVANFLGRRFAPQGTDVFETMVKYTGYGLQKVEADRAVIVVDKQAMSITLLLDPENFYGSSVTGTLTVSDELKAFSINAARTFTREELVKLLRFSGLYFPDRDKFETLVKSYQSFSAKAYIDMQTEADTRGNKTNNYSKRVETALPDEFVLKIPIFKGQPEETFRVEICLEVTDGSARFWFESVELHELTKTRIDEIFAAQLKGCEGFVIINK
jgi:hypothetical protein